MIRDLIKWVVPGLATVLAGTTLCLAMTSADMSADLTSRSAAAMADGGYDWAELSLNGRDLTLAGTTTDQTLLDSAVSRLALLPGIRSVTPQVTLAPIARPYRLEARIEQGAISLVGGVPDETTRQQLLALAGLEQGALDLRSGIPDRRAWTSGAAYAIQQLQYFDQGTITVSDRSVSMAGRAKSERAFRDLLIVLRAGAPEGLTLDAVAITPALISPYHWSASFDGKRIDVSGYVPDDALAERLRTADVSGAQVATGLALGSGEPTGFAELSQNLLVQLSRLEYGAAGIVDGQSTLSGAPATIEIAQAITDALQPSGTIIVLEPPRIDDYWMSATRQPGGVVVFDGYVPDEATREAFSLRQNADTSYLKLGRGAPERYRSGADFGLDALERMSEGRMALRDNALTIAGTARSGADYDALLAMLAGDTPQGVVLDSAEILAPRASTYAWSATKATSGAVTLTGLVPNAAAAADLRAAAGESTAQTMTYASGEPDNFLNSAKTALALLAQLSDGSVVYDGLGWTLSGTARSPADKSAIDAEFLAQKLAAAGWSMAVTEPAPTLAAVTPYTWSATRAPDGVTLMGQVPNQSLKSYLAVHAGEGVVDSTVLEAGAPADFVAAAKAGLDAVLALVEGEVRFDGTTWALTGQAASAAQRDATLSTLAAAINSGDWSINITVSTPAAASAPAVPPTAAVATPEPTPAPAAFAEPEPLAAPEPVAEPAPAIVPAPAPVAAPAAAPAPEPVAAPEPVMPPPPTSPSAPRPADITACAAPVSELSERNSILFQSGAALITAESKAALDELAVDLAACPDAVVHIEGHTDADGDEGLNLALSVARAEAVVNALVARGVLPARLYAVGYGETTPIADNETAQGKRLNRRIVVTVRPEHY